MADLDAGVATRKKGRPRTSETAAPSLVEILNLVRTERSTTRQEIERESELGRAVVADRLGTLIELGFVDESELGTATGGRAPRLVRFCTDRASILVATLDQTALGVGIADLSGRLIMEHHEEADLTEPVSILCDRLTSLFRWIVERQGDQHDLWGISISTPGAVADGRETSFQVSTPPVLPGWESFPIVEHLVETFDAPVWLRSSVETMSMGELRAGAGIGHKTMLIIKVGKRIGAGLVSDGILFRGAQGAAGLIGSVPVTIGDRTGTLERMAGSDAIAEEGRAAAERGQSPIIADLIRRGQRITAVEVAQAAQMGDRGAIDILSQSGRLIGQVVATLANMLNPEIIVLSGSIAQTNDILLASAREAIYGACHPLVSRDLQIIRSQMGSSSGLVGAAITAAEGLFAPSTLREWIMAGRPQAHPVFAELIKRISAKKIDGAEAPHPPETRKGKR
ncbi:ROK family protein [Rhizobium bangladeshense]|uniref:ROK family protein n=1 Tax=Rhizobium bangladeshense TaxID=1138189 RepID=UPI001C838B1D|nr:ROK family protein [Rhizobium bangladeshense]MBX4893278.1 ROK family protein [Rhizobium bangladeshense]MBX4898787.1 ROK family protein [Rhizobium bangladeshense]MBY3616916.1 ROK family protein [Rhizobium bangladeshense]